MFNVVTCKIRTHLFVLKIMSLFADSIVLFQMSLCFVMIWGKTKIGPYHRGPTDCVPTAATAPVPKSLLVLLSDPESKGSRLVRQEISISR